MYVLCFNVASEYETMTFFSHWLYLFLSIFERVGLGEKKSELSSNQCQELVDVWADWMTCGAFGMTANQRGGQHLSPRFSFPATIVIYFDDRFSPIFLVGEVVFRHPEPNKSGFKVSHQYMRGFCLPFYFYINVELKSSTILSGRRFSQNLGPMTPYIFRDIFIFYFFFVSFIDPAKGQIE